MTRSESYAASQYSIRQPRRRWRTSLGALVGLFLAMVMVGATIPAAQAAPIANAGHLGESTLGPQWRRVLLLRDYNTRVVVAGTTLLGLAAGMIGSFTLLRKRALMGDALSHATLPGIGLAFIIATAAGFPGKSLALLLGGGAVTGVLGMLTILVIRTWTRLKEDAALGIVLSVFFGGGIAVLVIAQQMPGGHAAGLEGFIYGKTASMVAGDAWLIGGTALGCAVLTTLFYKELKLICFDEEFAGAEGFRVLAIDLLLMGMVTVVTIIGLQAVGLILMIALLVIPAAAARFWTDRIAPMTLLASGIGALSCMVGAAASALFPRLPSGAMIVLSAAAMFLASMIFGPARGSLVRWLRRRSVNQKVDRQHLLRGIYEFLEREAGGGAGVSIEDVRPVPWDAVRRMRSWSHRRLERCVRRAVSEGLVRLHSDRSVELTPRGLERAGRMVHDHRLWEMYLITYAEMAPSRVDRDADAIEHVLDADMIQRLERLLRQQREVHGIPASPHAGAAPAGKGSEEGGHAGN